MSICEAYSAESFGSSVCGGNLPQSMQIPRQHRAASSTEEALRRQGLLSEEEIGAILGRIEMAEAWLDPVAVEDGETSP